MDFDNENEGFQIEKESYEMVPKKELHEISLSVIKESALQPPISTYTTIKNYPTPHFINSVYSIPDKPIEKSSKINAWTATRDSTIHQQFDTQYYELIYRKFNEEKTNYRFYKQYGKDQYRTFDDDQSEYYQEKEENDFRMTGSLQDWKVLIKPSPGLHFHSNFQGGNLERVYKSLDYPNSYFLILSNDTNTIGFNQWFYFKALNTSAKSIKAKFIIANCNKKTIGCISQLGICYFSLRDYRLHGEGWKRLTRGVIINNQNNLRRQPNTSYHTLEFQYTFRLEESVYFSLTLPYTFSKLKKFIEEMPDGFQMIGTTFCGNPLHVYKTGNPCAKKTILITSRQHPSQTSSSFVVEGVINRLQKMSPLINLLKKRYKILVIPMVNPDGVIHGNSRTNLLGFDVNRKWEEVPDKNYSHQIYYIYHRYLKNLSSIEYLIDLHGHSKKLNCFGYFSLKRSLAAIVAYEMAEKLPWFRIQSCQLARTVPPNTLRHFAANQLNIAKAITIETSIYGWTDSQNRILSFTPEQMQSIGSALVDTLSRIQLQKKTASDLFKNIKFGEEYVSSDSDPQGDYFVNKQRTTQLFGKDEQRKNAKTKQKVLKSPTKIRIKTMATSFYKPTMSSSIRERARTQFNMQKIDMGLNFDQGKMTLRKKKMQMRVNFQRKPIVMDTRTIHNKSSFQQGNNSLSFTYLNKLQKNKSMKS